MKHESNSARPEFLHPPNDIRSPAGHRILYVTGHAMNACMKRLSCTRDEALAKIRKVIELGMEIETPHGKAIRFDTDVVGIAPSSQGKLQGHPWYIVVTYYYIVVRSMMQEVWQNNGRATFGAKPGRVAALKRQRKTEKWRRRRKNRSRRDRP